MHPQVAEHPVTATEQSRITLRLLLTLVALIAPPTGYVLLTLRDVSWELRNINTKLDRIDSDAVTRTELEAWRREFAADASAGPPKFPWE